MSGAVVVTPSTGAAWATAWEQFEGIRKGLIALSLTNYDATTVPQIASGSWIEAVGSIYKWTGNDAVVGGLTANAINYITMVPSGAGAGAILTPTWSDTPPTWSDAYQGYFSGTTRYAGGCYYDGANYYSKWVYYNRDVYLKEKTLQIPIVGYSSNVGNVAAYVSHAMINTLTPNQGIYIPVYLPDGAIITEFYTYCSAHTTGTAALVLSYSPVTASTRTTMATTSHAATGGQTDSTITDPLVDIETNVYRVDLLRTVGTAAMTISGIRIKAIVRNRSVF